MLEYDIQEIAFLEAFGKKVVIHTNSDRLGIKQDTISGYSLSGLLSLIDHASFVQCHKSYIVNKSHIEKIHKSEKRIFLKGFETPVPIGNKYQAGLRGEPWKRFGACYSFFWLQGCCFSVLKRCFRMKIILLSEENMDYTRFSSYFAWV